LFIVKIIFYPLSDSIVKRVLGIRFLPIVHIGQAELFVSIPERLMEEIFD